MDGIYTTDMQMTDPRKPFWIITVKSIIMTECFPHLVSLQTRSIIELLIGQYYDWLTWRDIVEFESVNQPK